MNWLILIVLFALIGYLLDREIYFYEGVHLGPRVQAWLYDRWAAKYDEDKRASQAHDDEMLAGPLLNTLHEIPKPFVLDFATGTGRLAFALVSRPDFKGRITAVDLSRGMLEQAASKLGQRLNNPSGDRVEFLRHSTLPLPFPDGAFDAVCALEVLEHLPSMVAPLAEFSRLLRPGGILLTSRGTEAFGRRAKVKGAVEFTALLERCGFEQINISKWWKLYDRVMAAKRGPSNRTKAKGLSDMLKCSGCQSIHWIKRPRGWKCQDCGNEVSITEEGIILYR